MSTRWFRPLALTILSLTVAFWLWFGIASASGEAMGPINWIAHLIVPGGILLLSTLVALRWKAAGGVILLVEGFVVGLGYPALALGRFPPVTVAMVLLTLSLPPLIAGALLLTDWLETRRVTA